LILNLTEKQHRKITQECPFYQSSRITSITTKIKTRNEADSLLPVRRWETMISLI
jgi:hypothetical protein